jgi:hypothetical protein
MPVKYTVVPYKTPSKPGEPLTYYPRLGELGSFYLSIQAEGSSDAKSVNASKIKRNKLHFRAGKLVKQMLKHLDYRKY